MDNAEIAEEKGGSSSTISSQFGLPKKCLLAHHQKVNTDEKALRILLRMIYYSSDEKNTQKILTNFQSCFFTSFYHKLY